MLIRIFKTTQLIPLFLLAFISALIWFFSWKIYGFSVRQADGMPLYDLSGYLFLHLPVPVLVMTGWILTTTQAIHLNLILNKHEILYKQSLVPSLIYVVLAGFIPSFLSFHPVLFVNSILIFAIDKLFSLYKSQSPLSPAFDASLLFAIAALFYLPAIVFFGLYIISVLILRPLSWREATVGLLGFCIPFFLAFTYYFLNDKLDLFYNRIFFSGFNKVISITHFTVGKYIYSAGFVVLILILSILRLQGNYYKNVTKSRLGQQVLLLMIPAGLIVVFVAVEESLYRYAILTIPLSVYLGYYFISGKRQLFAEIVFTLLLAALIINYLPVG